jgi:hypothetical protein
MTTLTAFYDLQIGPVSYDIVPFLVQAKIEQQRIGAGRLHVVMVGDIRKKPQYDEAEAEWRLMNICVPACRLFGATFTLAADWLQAERIASEKDWKQWPPDWNRQTLEKRWHLIGGVIRSSVAGAKIPTIKPSEFALRKVRERYGREPFVTMTIRQTYLPERNSDPDDWEVLFEHVTASGFEVEMLYDTSVALSEGFGFGELNLDLRAAIYEQAALNLQANNGAASLCWFGSKPYRMFGAGHPAEEWDGLFVKQGLPLGTQWPWALSQQNLCYGKETLDQMIAEFDEWASATR